MSYRNHRRNRPFDFAHGGPFDSAHGRPVSRIRVALLAIAGWLALLGAFSPRRVTAAEANAIAAALQSISAAQLQQCVNMLADDAFEGREAGSRGGRAACA